MKGMLIGLMMFGFGTLALAEEDSGHDMSGHGHAQHEQTMQHESMHASKPFLVKKHVDGYTVSFHVMQTMGDMSHGGSHNLMVKVEKEGNEILDARINSKVFFPNKTTDSKMLMFMDGWYMNGYDLSQEGQHGLMILFKTKDGKKHKASVYYPEMK